MGRLAGYSLFNYSMNCQQNKRIIRKPANAAEHIVLERKREAPTINILNVKQGIGSSWMLNKIRYLNNLPFHNLSSIDINTAIYWNLKC